MMLRPKKLLPFLTTHIIQQVRFHQSSGAIYIGDYKGRIVIKRDSGDGTDIIRHWHALPLGDFLVLEGGGILSGGQESVLVRWNNVSTLDDEDEYGDADPLHKKRKLKEGKEFISRLGGSIISLQLSNPVSEYFATSSLFILTSDNELIQIDLMGFTIKSRFSLFNNNSPLVICNSSFTICPSNAPGGLMLYSLEKAQVLNIYYPERFKFRFSPNEPNETIEYPVFYSLSVNDRYLASIENDLGQQILRIHSISSDDGALITLEQECVVYSPHNNTQKLGCGWFGVNQLVTHDPSHLLRVWKCGTCVLEENQGKWRCSKEVENVSHFSCNEKYLVYIVEECQLFVNHEKKYDLPDLGNICGLFLLDDNVLIQTDGQQLFVVNLNSSEFTVVKAFYNCTLRMVVGVDKSKNAILYDYVDGNRFLVENIDFSSDDPFKNKSACDSNLICIGFDGNGRLVKQYTNYLEFSRSDLIPAAITKLDIFDATGKEETLVLG